MALQPSSPIIVNGKSYDKVALSMAVSPVWQGANVTASVSMVFTPYRYDDFGNVDKLDGHDKCVVIANIDSEVMSDMDLAQSMYIFMQSIQVYVNAKGI